MAMRDRDLSWSEHTMPGSQLAGETSRENQIKTDAQTAPLPAVGLPSISSPIQAREDGGAFRRGHAFVSTATNKAPDTMN